jgi:hypothetical protein
VVAAFILAVVLHVAPIVWIEKQQERSAVTAAATDFIQPIEKAALETAARSDAARGIQGRTAVD